MKITPSSILTDKIYKRARKIFGILVCIGKGNSMLSFIEHGMTDQELPFEIPQEASLQQTWMSTRESFQGFSLRELDAFSRVQWSFLAPVFYSDKETVNHYDFDSRAVLPFVDDAEFEARSGGFGEVWSVVIHPSHHTLLGSVSPPLVYYLLRLTDCRKATCDLPSNDYTPEIKQISIERLQC